MQSSESVTERMLEALELFQYAYRFRDSLFVLALHPEVPLANILTDLKLLQASHITTMVVCAATPPLEQQLQVYNEHGHRFVYLSHESGKPAGESVRSRLRWALKNDYVPVIAVEVSSDSPVGGWNKRLDSQAVQLSVEMKADKLFFLVPFRGLEVDGVLQSHLSWKEIQACLDEGRSLNLLSDQLRFLLEHSRAGGLEFVLLSGSSGSLFQEIFTHLGSGTLLTEEYPNVIRRGRIRDVSDIARLLKPHIEDGTVRPISEDEIAAAIESFFVYTVNGALVAAAQLRDYGEAAELAKFCTLPRFQGKGRARELARKMLETARLEDKEYVFALSISPKMWEFFTSLGFAEVPRYTLPERWKERYDFSRPSKAFVLKL